VDSSRFAGAWPWRRTKANRSKRELPLALLLFNVTKFTLSFDSLARVRSHMKSCDWPPTGKNGQTRSLEPPKNALRIAVVRII